LGSSSIKEISSSESKKINLYRPSNAQDVSRKFLSIRKDVNISRQTARNSGIVKRNSGFGKVNPPLSKRISPQIGKSSGNTRMLSLTNVKIDLYKGVVLQELIEPNTENDGAYTWTVSASLPDDSDYKVRISSVSEPGIYDESENFTIEEKSITVTEPTGITVWTKGTSANINWTSTGTINDVKIELHKPSGLEQIIVSSTTNNGTYTWTQVNPALTSAKNYKVKIICVSVPEVFDESDNFEIKN